MGNRSKHTEALRCTVCQRCVIDLAALARHIRISHGRDVAVPDCERMLFEKQSEVPSSAKNLPKLEFITRRPKFVGLWGACDLCGKSSTRRWLFERTTRGDVVVCASCRERMTHKSKHNEALDSWARLPGSYGG